MLGFGYVTATGGGHAMHVMLSAFSPEEDPSMQVRINNQLNVRRYLYQSPIGYGLGSTGSIGKVHSPYTFLGTFSPDSEYVRIVIETGFIGLAFYLFIMYLGLNNALQSLKKYHDEFSHNLRMVMVALIFMFILGQYTQEILNVLPLKTFFAYCFAYVSLSNTDLIRGK